MVDLVDISHCLKSGFRDEDTTAQYFMDVINKPIFRAIPVRLLKVVRKLSYGLPGIRAQQPARIDRNLNPRSCSAVASRAACLILCLSSAVVVGQDFYQPRLNDHSLRGNENRQRGVRQSGQGQPLSDQGDFRSFGDQTITSAEFDKPVPDKNQTYQGVRQAVFQSEDRHPSSVAETRQHQSQYQPPTQGPSVPVTRAARQLRPVPPEQTQTARPAADNFPETTISSHETRVRQVGLTNVAVRMGDDASGLLAADTAPQVTTAQNANTEAPFLDLTGGRDNDAPLTSTPGSGMQPTAFSSEQFVTMLIWILVLICLMVLTILGLRRWQRTRGLLPVVNGQSRVLQTLSLGPGRTVSLIEMNGLRALVGADAWGIRTIVLAPPSFDEALSTAAESDVSQTLLEA